MTAPFAFSQHRLNFYRLNVVKNFHCCDKPSSSLFVFAVVVAVFDVAVVAVVAAVDDVVVVRQIQSLMRRRDRRQSNPHDGCSQATHPIKCFPCFSSKRHSHPRAAIKGGSPGLVVM